MNPFQINSASRPLKGRISIPPDKSITHRAIIISAISKGTTRIKKFARNDDCLTTLKVFKRLGVKIKIKGASLLVYGRGLRGLSTPNGKLSAGASGTTIRLLSGVLSGQKFSSTMAADKSLSRRPMLRVIAPLRMMGAKINAIGNSHNAIREEYPPLTIRGGGLKPITYKLPVASAQVKSAILLAGLYASGTTRVIEPIKTRDHTERMLKLFGADLKVKGKVIAIKGQKELYSPSLVNIPGDISSASFFILAATIVAGSRLVIKSVGLNSSRTGLIRVLKRMGADIEVISKKQEARNCEPEGDLIIKSNILRGTKVKQLEIPSLIDEVPILMVAACYAKGETLFEGVDELRVKEADRISSMAQNLRKMGAKIKILSRKNRTDLVVIGAKRIVGAKVSSFGDHRTAMSLLIAGLAARKSTTVDDIDCINKSFPEFIRMLQALIK